MKNPLKFVPCRKCMGVRHQIVKSYMVIPQGFYSETVKGQKVLIECECHKKFMHEIQLYDKFIAYGIPYSYRDYDIYKNYSGPNTKKLADLEKYIANFSKPEYSSALLYFHGMTGTQKTKTALWLASQVILQGKTVSYTKMFDLVSALTASERFDEQPKNSIQVGLLESADLLIIDDAFDMERISLWKSGYQLQFIDAFLRNRLSQNKGLVIISRFRPQDIVSQGFSESIQALVTQQVNLKKTLIEFNDSYELYQLNPKGLFDE